MLEIFLIKFLKEYHRQRRKSAIQRDIALGRITEEEARKLPEDYGRALNTGGRRRASHFHHPLAIWICYR